MKKLMIGFALVCFVAFGTLGIQSVVASSDNVEIVKMNLDDEPKKDKKTEAKADGKDKKGTKDAKAAGDCKTSCKDGSSKCHTKTNCCPSKSTKCEDKKEGGGKK